jgi:16S rRNA (guanine527-N7)-methyltransferase
VTINTPNQSLEIPSKASLHNAFSALQLVCKDDSEGDDHRVDQLLMFVDMLLKWNQTYNLTALKNVSEVLDLHVVDSLTVLPNLKAYFQEKRITSPTILDVGSGAGLPGIVLAIMKANYKICCLDAVEKKTAFVSAVKGELGLKNLTSKHARVERLESMQADVVISRAFASLSDFVELAQNHVKECGRLVAMKANGVEDEAAELARQHPNWKVKSVEQLFVPEKKVMRCLVWLQQEK